jgi:hypothetical protein
VIGGLLADLLVKRGMIRLGPSGIARGCGLDPADLDLFGLIILIYSTPRLSAKLRLQADHLRLNLQGLALLDVVGPGRLSPCRWAHRFSLFQGALKLPKDLLQAGPFSLGRIEASWFMRKGRGIRERFSPRDPASFTLGRLLPSQLPQQAHQEPDCRKNYQPVELH